MNLANDAPYLLKTEKAMLRGTWVSNIWTAAYWNCVHFCSKRHRGRIGLNLQHCQICLKGEAMAAMWEHEPTMQNADMCLRLQRQDITGWMSSRSVHIV